jgi:hypothetical protein
MDNPIFCRILVKKVQFSVILLNRPCHSYHCHPNGINHPNHPPPSCSDDLFLSFQYLVNDVDVPTQKSSPSQCRATKQTNKQKKVTGPQTEKGLCCPAMINIVFSYLLLT